MPIVDDPVDFGRIASVNAISDIYAMGGTPLMAIAVLGWPINTVPLEAAKLVLDGARLACNEAGIPLAGGHSIDAPEPIFGLAVTGRVPLTNLRTNSGARDGDVLFLTKPLGIGILTTAEKKGILRPEHATLARDVMVRLNSAGARFGTLPYVHAMTDVTGFGLLGHLIEMCEGADLYAEIDLASIPLIDPSIRDYIAQGSIPGGTHRNYDSYGHKVTLAAKTATASTATTQSGTPRTATSQSGTSHTATSQSGTSHTATAHTETTQSEGLPLDVKAILCDPQTSGGLLVAVAAEMAGEMEGVRIGTLKKLSDNANRVTVK